MSADSPAPTANRSRRPMLARVEVVEQLTPRMVRIVLGGEDLEGFAAGAFTDHYVKVVLPPPGAPYGPPFDVEDVRATRPREEWPRTRSYTVRAWDPDRRRLTLDFIVHGDEGIAGPWAAAARPGDTLQLTGPGGAYTPDPGAAWHLMVGDESVIPAVAVSLARIPPGVPVHVVLEVDGPEEEQPLSSPGELALQWLHADGHAAGGEEPLLAAVRELDLPGGPGHAFVHGEAGAVRAVRRHLVLERGLPRDALSASGYWKRDRTDELWRAEKAEWKRQVEEDDRGAPAD